MRIKCLCFANLGMLVCSQKCDEMQKQYQAMKIESEQKIQELKVMLALLQSMPTSFAMLSLLPCSHFPSVFISSKRWKKKSRFRLIRSYLCICDVLSTSGTGTQRLWLIVLLDKSCITTMVLVDCFFATLQQSKDSLSQMAFRRVHCIN